MTDIAKILKNDKNLVFLNQLINKYPKARIYLVGGMVRDIILERTSKDYDFVVAGIRPDILEKFLKTLGQVDYVGKSFGVYKFKPKNTDLKEPMDIALPRTEHSLFLMGGYKEFNVKPDYRLPIEKDLSRRDFTINALAWDVKNKKIIDSTGGLSDLAGERIKAVGEAEKRFREDYSRILRGLRFAVQLHFELEHETWMATKIMMKHLNNIKVPREVIAKEVIKSFTADPVRAFDAYDATGAFRVLMPEILHTRGCSQPTKYHSEGDVWNHTRLAIESLFSPEFAKQFPRVKPDAELIFATLFHDIGKPYAARWRSKMKTSFYGHEVVGTKLVMDICQRLRLSSYQGLVDCHNLAWLVRHHLIVTHAPPHQLKPHTLEKYFVASGLGDKLMQLIFADKSASLAQNNQPALSNFYDSVQLVKEIKETGYAKKRPKILLDGYEIIKTLKIKPGPQVGKIIERLRNAQLKKKIRTKKQALMFLEKNYGHKPRSRSRRAKTR